MAKNETRSIAPRIIANDVATFDGLKTIDDYSPANQAFTVVAIKVFYDGMIGSQTAETQAKAAAKAARDNRIQAEWAFHNASLGGKNQVRAQYGADSNQLQSLGLKKASEYKKPAKKKVAKGVK